MNITVITHDGASGSRAIRGADSRLLLSAVGPVRTRRASYIWPYGQLQRLAFRALRFVFDGEGKVAAWTRTWRTLWTVRWVNRPDRIVFANLNRETCLKWERERLSRRMKQ